MSIGATLSRIWRGFLDSNKTLFSAAKAGDIAFLEDQLDSGANPNAMDKRGIPPLFFAIVNGHANAARILLEKGADPNWADPAKDGMSALMFASVRGHIDIVRLLLNKGADPNARNVAGWSALFFAAMGKHSDIVNALIDKGGDPNLRNLAGCTSLMGIAGENHIEMLRILVERGADINIKDYQMGMTALMAAALNHCMESVEFLIDRGADMDVQANAGVTAMMLAIMTDSADYQRKISGIEIFISRGANVNIVDNNGWTALMYAAYEGIPEIVQKLLANGSNAKYRNKDGSTALELARQKERRQVVDILKRL